MTNSTRSMRFLMAFAASVLLCSVAEAAPSAPASSTESLAASLSQKLRGAVGQGIHSLAVAPLREVGSQRGSGIGQRVATELAAHLRSKGFSVRDWEALDRTQRERALAPAQGKSSVGGMPVDALIVGEATTLTAGRTRLNLRVVMVATGAAVATESAEISDSAQAGVVRAAVSEGVASSVDVAMRRLADSLVRSYSSRHDARYSRVAVLRFTETGDEAKKRELGSVVSAELSTSLRRDHNLLLVERTKLSEVMNELKLGQEGLVDSKSAPEIGKLADAQALVMGSVSEAGDRYLINARIVSTETAESLAAASEAVPAANLVSMSSEAVVLRSKKDAIFRSLLIPGWGQIYNREPVKGYAFMGGVGASLGAALFFQVMGQHFESQYRSQNTKDQLGTDPSGTAEHLRLQAESRYTDRNIALGVAGGLWLANIIDAYVSGVDGDKLIGNGLAAMPSPHGMTLAYAMKF